MFFYRGKLLPDASSIQTTTTKLCVCVHAWATCAKTGAEINHKVHLKICEDRKRIKDLVSIPVFT